MHISFLNFDRRHAPTTRTHRHLLQRFGAGIVMLQEGFEHVAVALEIMGPSAGGVDRNVWRDFVVAYLLRPTRALPA